MSDAVEYVYGWGRTKHIRGDPRPNSRTPMVGLCGADGDNPLIGEDRPVCKRCLSIAAKRSTRVTP